MITLAIVLGDMSCRLGSCVLFEFFLSKDLLEELASQKKKTPYARLLKPEAWHMLIIRQQHVQQMI
jgi:hypothetical protein